MNNAEYWARRLKIMEDALKDKSYEYVQNLERQFDIAIRDIENQIRAWYQRFADNNGITFAEAKKLLKTNELKEFRWTVQEYIEKGIENDVNGAWIKELENASARAHISRLDVLKYQLRQQAEMLTQARIQATTDASELAYTQSYYHTAFEVQKGLGVGWTMQSLNDDVIKKVLSRPWTVDNQTFRARCWKDKEKLVEVVNQQITRMVATGASPDKAIKTIAKQFNTTKSNAGRVVMTESAYFASAAQKDSFTELGVELYRIIGTLDGKMCEVCGDMDSRIYKMSEYIVGSTAPPFHPWCRCCTTPYFEDMEELGERFARDIETGERYKLPKDVTYNGWKAMQEAAYGSGFVDKKRKMSYNIGVDNEQYERYTNVLGSLAPKTLDEFEDIKLNNPKEWERLKYQYRTVNQYKIDSGSLTPQEILDLDEKIITEKRNNFTSKYKKSGNIAGAYIDGEAQSFYLAHSMINDASKTTAYKGNSHLVTLKDVRRFKYIDVVKSNGTIRTDTFFDTEAKLFEAFADLYDAKPFSSITMLSERGMCDSCKGVMEQFQKEYPEVIINVVSNKKVDSNVWKYRRNKK